MLYLETNNFQKATVKREIDRTTVTRMGHVSLGNDLYSHCLLSKISYPNPVW